MCLLISSTVSSCISFICLNLSIVLQSAPCFALLIWNPQPAVYASVACTAVHWTHRTGHLLNDARWPWWEGQGDSSRSHGDKNVLWSEPPSCYLWTWEALLSWHWETRDVTYCSDVIFLSLNYSPGAFLAYYSFVLLVFGVYHKERLMGRDISKVKRSFSVCGQWRGGWDLFSRNLSILGTVADGETSLGHPHLNLREERWESWVEPRGFAPREWVLVVESGRLGVFFSFQF